jgi:PqqD family protein of HPr-rel-A system
VNSDRPAPHPSVETAVLGAEAVLYDERSGMVHHLNASACAIWVLLVGGCSVDEVVTALSERTGIPPAEMQGHVVRTIGEFGSAGLLCD